MAAKSLGWTSDQLAEVLGYLANPRTQVKIEIQVPQKGQTEFEHEYRRLTGHNPPFVGHSGYSVLSSTSDKRAPQKRVIFNPAGMPPQHLVEHAQNDGRLDLLRVSRNLLVDRMLVHGFLMGQSAGEQIRQRINQAQHAAFDRGYQMANQ